MSLKVHVPVALPSVRLIAVMLAWLCGGMPSPVRAEQPTPPLVDLDASKLAPGPIEEWPNVGSLAGSFTSSGQSAPVVTDVAGRRAVSFADGKYFASSFKADAGITGGHPFTVGLWAFEPATVKRDVLLSWASRPQGTAEFGYGAGPDGAFFGWDKSAKYDHLPAPGAWHFLAYTSTGENLSVYVDGVLDIRRTMTIMPKAGGRVYLGAGWDSVGSKPTFPFHGSLARVLIWDRALTQQELRNSVGWYESYAPEPADHSTVAAEALVLRWQPGHADAKAFAVRLATDQAALSAVDLLSTKASEQLVKSPEFRPETLEPGHTYYWRIDQLDSGGKPLRKGKTWQFNTDAAPATSPMPRDRVAGVPVAFKALTWKPGRYAVKQKVYFGTDLEAVSRGTAENLGGEVIPSKEASTTVLPALKAGTTYYWRVATDNGPVATAPGDTWRFRTADESEPGDVTFFVGSDCHYGLGNNAELNRRVIDEMNGLPGAAFPKQLKGEVRTPRGVVLDGDLLDKGFEPKTSPADWAEFCKDYGLTGTDGRLAYPVFEGFGNHDGMTGKSFTREGIKQRNKQRPGLTMVSANGYHYSWDWDNVHLVQLNLFPGKDSADCIVGPPNHHPEDSLKFLRDDLAKNVTDRDKIVVVFCHYCYTGGMADWWTDAAKERFFDTLKGYRVLLIHGHSHGAYNYSWKGIPVISDGSTARPDGQTGDFLVVHLTHTRLTVAQRKVGGEWGLAFEAPLPGLVNSVQPAAPVPPHN